MKKRYIILSVLIVLFTAGYFSFDYWVNTAVREVINQQENPAFKIDFDNVKLRVFKEELVIYGLRIEEINADEGIKVSLKVAEARMDSIDANALLFERSIEIHSLYFSGPQISVSGTPQKKTSAPARKGLQGLFGTILEGGKIQNFDLRNGSLSIWRNRKEEGKPDAFITGFNLSARGIESDKYQATSIIPFKVKSLDQGFDKGVYTLPNSEILVIDSLKVLKNDRKVEIRKMHLAFPKPWLDVSDSLGFQTDIIEAEVGPIVLERIDVSPQLFENGVIEAGHLKIEHLDLKIHRDKRKPRINIKEQPNYNFLAGEMSLQLGIDSIEILKGSVKYIEMGAKRNKEAVIPFTLENALITNITTIETEQNTPIKLSAQASMNGHGHIKLNMELPYDETSLSVKSVVTDLDLTTMNETLRDMVGVEIKEGYVHSLILTMNADGYYANNQLDFQYEHLTVTLLDDTKAQEGTHFFLSAIANVAVKSTNMPSKNSYRNAVYHTERDRTRGMFNLIWNSMREGLEEIVITKSAAELEKAGAKIFHHKTKEEKAQRHEEHLKSKEEKHQEHLKAKEEKHEEHLKAKEEKHKKHQEHKKEKK
jgi:hypothetical protein